MSFTRLGRGPLVGLAAIAGAIGLAMPPAHAQSLPRSTMVQSDDGGTSVLSMVIPDADAIRRVDVRPEDTPGLARILALSDPQSEMFRDRLDAYVDAVEALELELPDGGPGGRGGGGEAADGEETLQQTISRVMREALDEVGLDPAMLDGDDVNVQFGIGINMEQTDPDTPPEPAVDVNLSIGPAPGVALSDDTLAKLEQAGRKAAEAVEAKAREQSVQEFMAQLRGPADGPDPWQQAIERGEQTRKAVRGYSAKRRQLRERLDVELQGMLGDGQLDQWPAADRWILRRHALPNGRLAGESIDVFAAVEELVAARPEVGDRIADAMPSLELALHQALAARESRMFETEFGIDEACLEGDVQKIRREGRTRRDLHVRVRDANLRALDTIAGLIGDLEATVDPWSEAVSGDDERAGLGTQARRAMGEAGRSGTSLGSVLVDRLHREAFSNIWAETPMHRAVDAVLGEDLADEAVATAMQIAEDYARRHATESRRIQRLALSEEPKRMSSMIDDLVAQIEGAVDAQPGLDDADENPVVTALERRLSLDRDAMRRLYGLVGSDVAARMPALPQVEDLGPVRIHVGDSDPDA